MIQFAGMWDQVDVDAERMERSGAGICGLGRSEWD